MDKLPFRNKITDYATMGKKGNVIYWDAIDNLTESYVNELMDFSTEEVKFESAFEHDITILEIAKQITDLATRLLTTRCGAEFPYIDENF